MSFLRSSLFVLCVLLLVPATRAQSIESDVSSFQDTLNEARDEHLNLIAPKTFQEASEYLAEAEQKMKDGDKMSDIREALKRGRKELANAKEYTEIGRVILKDALVARNDALEARAPEVANEKWTEAEDAIQSAGREIEKGDQDDAREDAKEAVKYYRQAELKAIQTDLLGTARKHRSEALEAEADEWAPQTWKLAENKLQKADRILKEDRYNRSESRTLAKEATQQFKHARLLSETIQRIDDDVETKAEMALLKYEDHIRRVAEALEADINFGDGMDAVTERLTASVQSLKEDRKNLQASLRDRRARIDRLQSVVDSLDARLATLEEREEKVSAQLQEKQERERTLKRVREVFDSKEAEVLTSGEALIVRMQGLNFPSGSAEIQPKNFGLLTKLQQVIREFSEGDITIFGHTDAQGNDAHNKKLSEERAEAVRQYLMANMDLSSDRMKAIGQGESEPIATNETEEGRSKNRRIDVRIQLN